MEFILTIIIFLISIPVGEYFGRSKHIGKWWTVVLMTCGIVPGLIALVTSPKASSQPTKGKGYLISGWISMFFLGVGSIILAFIVFENYKSNHNTIPNFVTQQFGLKLIFGIWFFIIGIYLDRLGSGKIMNNNPKYYFNNHNSINQSSFIESLISRHSKNKNDYRYYIVRNNQANGPFTIKELTSMQINEEDLVCLNGSKQWVKASEISELLDIITFNPPPIPIPVKEEEVVDDDEQVEMDKPAILPRIIKFEKLFDQNELEVFMYGLTIGIGDQVFDGGELAEGHYILPTGIEIDCKDGVIVNYFQQEGSFSEEVKLYIIAIIIIIIGLTIFTLIYTLIEK